MPIVRATLIRGYAADVKSRLAERLTDAVASIVRAQLDGITVVLDEVEPTSYMRGRQGRSPGLAKRPAGDIVVDFLRHMERRELDLARGYLTADFQMVFPGVSGGSPMSSLDELVAFSATRYRNVIKDISSVDEAHVGTRTTVFVSGTLSGEALDGSPFEGVRFIDRFEVEDEKISVQQVWNDLAIALALRSS